MSLRPSDCYFDGHHRRCNEKPRRSGTVSLSHYFELARLLLASLLAARPQEVICALHSRALPSSCWLDERHVRVTEANHHGSLRRLCGSPHKAPECTCAHCQCDPSHTHVKISSVQKPRQLSRHVSTP